MLGFDVSRRDETLPASLGGKRLERQRRRMRDFLLATDLKERVQTDLPMVWKQTFEPDVIAALASLSAGRCAFCERQVGAGKLAPYRFRPPGHAMPESTPQDRLCYLWLSFNWHNLFPICAQCRPMNASHFPVEGSRHIPVRTEMQKLIEEPAARPVDKERAVFRIPGSPGGLLPDGLRFALDGTFREGPTGWAETVEHFKLNRPSLVRERATAIRRSLSDLRKRRLVDGSGGSEALAALPHVDAIWSVGHRIAGQLSDLIGESAPRDLPSLRAFFERAFAADRYGEAIDRAIEALRREDEEEPGSIRIEEDREAPVAPPSERVRQREGGEAPHPPDLAHPRISRVAVRNYKSLEEVAFEMPAALPVDEQTRMLSQEEGEVPEAPCLLILGENATGKSSILEAVALACLRPDIRRALEAEEPKKLSPLRLTLNPEYMGDPKKPPRKSSRVEVDFHGAPALVLTVSTAKGAIAHTAASKADSRAMPLVFGYGAHRLYGDESAHDPVGRVGTLFSNTRELPDPQPFLVGLARDNPAALAEVVAALRHIIEIDGDFRDIEVVEGAAPGEERCVINIVKDRIDLPEDAPEATRQYVLSQRLDVVSSGYRAVLALVCDVFAGLLAETGGSAREARLARAIVLIDEIEAHLHPRWKMQIIGGLRRALPNVTFIVTSHDPLCVRGMMRGEVMALNRYQSATGDTGSTMPEVVEPVTDFGNIETWTVEQLLTSDLFQLFSVEGAETRHGFAAVAGILAREEEARAAKRAPDLTDEERRLKQAFVEQIASALPFGGVEITRVVQKALAEYLHERGRKDAAPPVEARQKAVDAVKDFLRELAL